MITQVNLIAAVSAVVLPAWFWYLTRPRPPLVPMSKRGLLARGTYVPRTSRRAA